MKLPSVIVGTVALAFTLLATSCHRSDTDRHEAATPVGSCRIAFLVRFGDYDDSPSDIYVVNPDGTGQRNLTRRWTLYEEGSPVWSPDGRKIAFTATQGSDLFATHLFVINADGSGRRQLTPAHNQMGTWSPDGRTIFYTRLNPSGSLSSWAMNADGTGKQRLEEFGEGAFLSPDGEHVVGIRDSGVESDYYGSPDVHVVEADGDNGRWLTRSGDTEVFGWSPDGQWILYKCMSRAPGLYVVKPDGSERKRLTQDPEDYDATWSPDGRLVLYSAQSSPGGIYVVALDGRPPRRLTRRLDDLNASWSPGGTRIVFYRDYGQIWMMNRDGTHVRPLAQPHGVAIYDLPAWSPSCK